MTDSTRELSRQIEQLRQENEDLKGIYARARAEQNTLEMVIAETSNKRLQAEINSMELEEIFSSISDPMWALKDNGRVIRANDAMLNLLDRPLEQVIGRQCRELLDYALCHSTSCPLAVCNSMTRQEYDIQLKCGSNKLRHYIISVAPLTTIVGTRAIVSQFKNITARKEAENKLAELNRILSDMARVDGLTGIANRRYFDEMVDREWRRLARDGKQPFSLILADIDCFKKYNDLYGHQTGDDCLIQVAQALKKTVLRPADLAARYGGEEFALLLPEIDLSGAETVGKRVLQAISALQIDHAGSDVSGTVTLSLGAATMIPSAHNAPASLIAMADKALYQAKQRGRNNLTLFQALRSPAAG